MTTSTGQSLLELLHREADGDLTPAERALLDEHNADPEVQAARAALRRAVMFLSGPNPPQPMPRSLAADIAADVALSKQLTSPPLPASVARSVAAEVALSRDLQAPMPRSVAGAVLSDIRAAQTLGHTPDIPASVAASVAAEIALSQVLTTPALPRSVASGVLAEIASDQQFRELPAPRPRASVAGLVASRIAQEKQAAVQPLEPELETPPPPVAAPASVHALGLQTTNFAPLPDAPRNPAPLLLVGALLAGLTLLAVTTVWPNLAAGAIVLRSLLEQVSPLAGVGLALLLLTSVLITWKPTPAIRTAGAGAFALSAVLTIPALFNLAGGQGGLTIGQNVTVSGPVRGNVIAIGGNVKLEPGARIEGEVVTLLGDVHRAEGAQVGGRVNALLGHAPDDVEAIQTAPVSNLSLATAAAFRPVLGWLGSAAWPQIFVALTGSLLLLLFIGGLAPNLARRQRHAPMRTLALGVLMLSALLLPALALALVGFLGPALLIMALTALVIATGLSVSVYDAGRAFAYRLRVPVPDAVGALLGLSTFAASLSYAPAAFTLALVGGAWGAGTLLLTRQHR